VGKLSENQAIEQHPLQSTVTQIESLKDLLSNESRLSTTFRQVTDPLQKVYKLLYNNSNGIEQFGFGLSEKLELLNMALLASKKLYQYRDPIFGKEIGVNFVQVGKFDLSIDEQENLDGFSILDPKRVATDYCIASFSIRAALDGFKNLLASSMTTENIKKYLEKCKQEIINTYLSSPGDDSVETQEGRRIIQSIYLSWQSLLINVITDMLKDGANEIGDPNTQEQEVTENTRIGVEILRDNYYLTEKQFRQV
jgi:hypothetical protein